MQGVAHGTVFEGSHARVGVLDRFGQKNAACLAGGKPGTDSEFPAKCAGNSCQSPVCGISVVLIIAMRRISAILLVGLFGFWLIGPALLAQDAGSQLPACCRRAGKHHCAMAAIQTQSPAGPVLHTGRCTLFPVGAAVPTDGTVSLPAASESIFAGLISHPASRPQMEALCRISYSRAGQKRGPPTPLS